VYINLNISKFWCDSPILSSDSDSTQKITSEMTLSCPTTKLCRSV